MKKTLAIGFAFVLTLSTVQGNAVRSYDVTIRRLDTAEEQLLYEQKRTIGLKKFEIDRELKEVRRQRSEANRLKAEAQAAQSRERTAYYNSLNRKANRPPPQAYRPPEPDWKTVETPRVVVKGIVKIGGQPVALVSGGQMVTSNQVFATTYGGEERYWRVTGISHEDAQFERVTRTGDPYIEPAPAAESRAPPPQRPSGFTAFFSLFR
jgi:hypothetical protein